MYIFDQGRTSGVSLGIGRLDAFGKTRKKKTGPDPAEALRHLVEMWKLKDRDAWSGVESHFLEWRKVRDKDNLGGGYKKGWEIYQLAAQAAMVLGDAASRYQRLITAMVLTVCDPELNASESMARAKKDEVLKDLLKDKLDLEENWVDVDIRLPRKSEGNLKRADGLFTREEGDRSAAFERAKRILRNQKEFQGLLPIGDYTIDGEKVPLGTTWTIPRWKKASIRKKSNRPLDRQLKSKEPPMWLDQC